MAGIRMKVEIKNYREIARKLKKDELLGGPWTAAMRHVEDIARSAWMGAAPADSGQLKAKITTKMQARPVPMWVRIKTSATRSSPKHRRYRYPNRQEYDPKSRNRGKLKASLAKAMGRVQAALDQAARAIEAKWRS